MGVVSRYLEEEGIPTTQISLVREHTEAIRPPRALWVPFMLGRPLGAPNDPSFQRAVLGAALQLLELPAGPVLRDFELDAPGASDEAESGAACPVHFDRPGTGDSLHRRLEQEIAQLQPWHDIAVKRRTASTVGVSGLGPADAAAFVVALAEGGEPANYRPGQPLGLSLKQACDDLRAFYEEAAGAQPGGLSATAMAEWLYHGTVLGEVFALLWREGVKHADEGVRTTAERFLVPWAVRQRLRDTAKWRATCRSARP